MVQLLRLLEIDPLDLLPQRPPFVMIDHLAGYDERTTTTTLVVTADNIFVEGGEMLATGMIENIAQTCAARLGYYNLISGQPVKIGYIGAVSNLHVERQARVGETLTTTITVEEEVMGMTLASATVAVGDETIVTASIKISVR